MDSEIALVPLRHAEAETLQNLVQINQRRTPLALLREPAKRIEDFPKDDYQRAKAGGLIELFHLVAAAQPDCTLRLSYGESYSLSLQALPQGTLLAHVNEKVVLDSRRAGQEILRVLDGQWMAAVLQYLQEAEAAAEAAAERAELERRNTAYNRLHAL